MHPKTCELGKLFSVGHLHALKKCLFHPLLLLLFSPWGDRRCQPTNPPPECGGVEGRKEYKIRKEEEKKKNKKEGSWPPPLLLLLLLLLAVTVANAPLLLFFHVHFESLSWAHPPPSSPSSPLSVRTLRFVGRPDS